MINHERGHSRPSYLAIKDGKILWFIPLSTKVSKYQKIIDIKKKKYGACKTILIKKIAGTEQAILIQNAFPTLDKYIKNIHTISGIEIKVPPKISKEIVLALKYVIFFKKTQKHRPVFYRYR